MNSSSSENDRAALGQLVDPNVHVSPGKAYYTSIEELSSDKKWQEKEVLSIGDVKELWNLVRSQSGNGIKTIHLNELLLGSKVNIPGLEIPKRNPELEKRINALKNQLDEQEYHRMTRNVNQVSSPYKSKVQQEDSIGAQLKQMNSAIFAALQFVISLAAAFFFGFTGVQVFVGPLDLPVRLLLGIASAVLVGAADLYFLVVHLDASEALQDKELQQSRGKLKIKEN